jgi:DNA-binding MarR family transcriptional regulator
MTIDTRTSPSAADALEHPDLTTMGLFFEAHAGLAREFERRLAADCGLSVQWFEVLMRLARSPERRLRMSDLAAQSSLTASGLTRVVDRLAEHGLVTREACPSDRRVSYAVLTPDGFERIAAAVPVHLGHIEELVRSVLSPTEFDGFASTMRKLRDAFNPCAGRAGTTGG